MALEDPAPADPPVALPAAASPEPPACASARVEPSIRTVDKAIVVSFMGLSFHRGKDNQPFHSSVPNKCKISLGNLDPDRHGTGTFVKGFCWCSHPGAKSKAPDCAEALPQWRRGTSILHLSCAKLSHTASSVCPVANFRRKKYAAGLFKSELQGDDDLTLDNWFFCEPSALFGVGARRPADDATGQRSPFFSPERWGRLAADAHKRRSMR
jgi:hypothetical protein